MRMLIRDSSLLRAQDCTAVPCSVNAQSPGHPGYCQFISGLEEISPQFLLIRHWPALSLFFREISGLSKNHVGDRRSFGNVRPTPHYCKENYSLGFLRTGVCQFHGMYDVCGV